MELETINKLYLELSQITTATTAREILLQKQLAEARRDAERLDWLGNQFVTVRVPLRYGSKECFMDSPTDNDGEFIPWNIRAAIDAARGGSNA